MAPTGDEEPEGSAALEDDAGDPLTEPEGLAAAATFVISSGITGGLPPSEASIDPSDLIASGFAAKKVWVYRTFSAMKEWDQSGKLAMSRL